MSDGQFWMIYFILLLPRLNVHDSKLLSTPKARFLCFIYHILVLLLFLLGYASIIGHTYDLLCPPNIYIYIYICTQTQSALGDVEQPP